MQALTFDYRDIFRIPRLAWSSRKIHIAFRGILAAWGLYLVTTYLALLLTETGRKTGIVSLFRYFEFFPCLVPASPGTVPLIVWFIGIALSGFVLLLTAAAVARVAFEDLRGNEVYQTKEAIGFARKQKYNIALAVLVPLVLAFFVFLVFTAVGAAGRIPVLGEAVVSLFAFPLFLWALLGIFTLAAFFAAAFLVPAVSACTGEDVLEVVIQVFSSLYKEPCRLFFYECLAKIVIKLTVLVLAFASLVSFHVMNVLIGLAMGFKYSEILTTALYRIPFLMESKVFVSSMLGLQNILGVPYIVDTAAAPASVKAAGWVFGVGMILVFVWIVSYCFSAFASSQVVIYLAIRKRKDGDDLRLKAHLTDFAPEGTEPS